MLATHRWQASAKMAVSSAEGEANGQKARAIRREKRLEQALKARREGACQGLVARAKAGNRALGRGGALEEPARDRQANRNRARSESRMNSGAVGKRHVEADARHLAVAVPRAAVKLPVGREADMVHGFAVRA